MYFFWRILSKSHHDHDHREDVLVRDTYIGSIINKQIITSTNML